MGIYLAHHHQPSPWHNAQQFLPHAHFLPTLYSACTKAGVKDEQTGEVRADEGLTQFRCDWEVSLDFRGLAGG